MVKWLRGQVRVCVDPLPLDTCPRCRYTMTLGKSLDWDESPFTAFCVRPE
jgi:hypothetical protein